MSTDIHSANCNLITQNGSFFDVTHTFKVGSATYHVLGLRRDRPTYKNTYYVFNCSDNQHELTKESLPKSVRFKRLSKTSEQISESNQRSLTAHHSTSASIDDSTTDQKQKTKSGLRRSRTRTESPKKSEINLETMQENFTKAIKQDRLLLLASLRRELNMKKKSLLQSMKKEKQTLLQATIEANKKEEIIRLLEEQKTALTNLNEKCIETTASSIESLKQTLIETIETQSNASQSTQELQHTLIQTIEEEVKKISSKNEEILKSTSEETNAISHLQTTILNKLEDYSTAKTNDDNKTLNRLFNEQKQVLTDVLTQQQQQTFSLDMVKQTVVDAFNEQRSSSFNVMNNIGHSQELNSNNITNISSEQNLFNNNTAIDQTNKTLPRMKTNQLSRSSTQLSSKIAVKNPADQHLFKVSIRSPEPAHIYAKLIIDGMECSRRLHTLCQRDVIQDDVYNCYVAPPTKDGPYEVVIYAKTNEETIYRATIRIRLPGSNLSQPVTFPMVHQAFERHQCVLIEPLQRLLRQNQQLLIHMIVPDAETVKIQNGDETTELDVNEYKKGIVKKKIRVRGDVHVLGCWDKKLDSTICVFNMV